MWTDYTCNTLSWSNITGGTLRIARSTTMWSLRIIDNLTNGTRASMDSIKCIGRVAA